MVMIRYTTPKLPTLLAIEIAELIVSWSGATGLLTMLMIQLMMGPEFTDTDSDFTPIFPIIGMDPRTQIALLKSMLRKRVPDDDIPALDAILDRMEKIKKMRDVVAHCLWEPGKRDHEMYGIILKTTHRARMSRHHFSPARIHSFADALENLAAELVTTLQRHGYLRQLSPSHGRYV